MRCLNLELAENRNFTGNPVVSVNACLQRWRSASNLLARSPPPGSDSVSLS